MTRSFPAGHRCLLVDQLIGSAPVVHPERHHSPHPLGFLFFYAIRWTNKAYLRRGVVTLQRWPTFRTGTNRCERGAVNQSVSSSPSPPCCCHAPHFTDHELVILGQVAAGATNEEIAASMNVSGHTVAGHLRNMLSRSQARNRAELTARAYAAGVLVSQTWPPELSGRRCLQVPAAPPLALGPRAGIPAP